MSESDLDHVSLWESINCSTSGSQDPADIWKVDLDARGERVRELGQLLSPDEAARADRFHSALDRRRFIAARGSLRVVLANYLHTKAVEIRFAYTSGQKPVLAHPPLAPEEALCFNVSHSDALALIAVVRRRAVGIDVERKRADFNPEALAKRFFSSPECAALARVPPQERHYAFLRYWVCKEAYLKALGTGLSRPLNDFVVSLEDNSIKPVYAAGVDEATAPYRIHPFSIHPFSIHPFSIHPFSIHPFSPDPEYVAALAIEVL